MPDRPHIISIFVSSPGDVDEERKALKDVIDRINDTDGKDRGIRLELFRWERNVARRIGAGPQDVVDEQTEAYDVYLGIMAARLGEGTRKEFEDAHARYKAEGTPWISFFFREGVVPGSEPSSVRAYADVCEFREELQKLGLVNTYADGAFAQDVEQHLRMVLRELRKPDEAPQPPPRTAATPVASAAAAAPSARATATSR